MLFVYWNRHEIKFILSYLILYHYSECTMTLDIVYVVDTSVSITPNDWIRVVGFLVGMTQTLTIGVNEVGPLRWRHNGRDGVSNHQPHDCLLKRLFRRRAKKTSKLRVTGLCEGNSPVTGEFPAQRASNAEKCFHLMTSSCIWGTFCNEHL